MAEKKENLEFICMFLKYFQDSKIILCDETLLDRDGMAYIHSYADLYVYKYTALSTFENFQYNQNDELGIENGIFFGSSSHRINYHQDIDYKAD